MMQMKNLFLVLVAAVLVVGCGDERDTSSRSTSASTNLSKERFMEVKGHKTISRLIQEVECNSEEETAKLSYFETDVETTLRSDDGRTQVIPEVVRIYIDSKTGKFVSYSESKVSATVMTTANITNKYDIVDDELKINNYGRVIVDGGELAVDRLNSTKGVLVLKKNMKVEKSEDLVFYKMICGK